MLKGKLEILVGISASGKSSYAHEKWLKDPLNTVIVSRDNIRQMFGFGEQTVSSYYDREDMFKLEKEVTKVFNTLVYDALESGKTVIADNTHLKRKFIEDYKYWNVPTEIKVFTVTLKEALTRDMGRVRSVGEEVIQKQYSQFVNLSKDLEKEVIEFEVLTPFVHDTGKEFCTILDIDGTVAQKCDRDIYDGSKCHLDYLIEPVYNAIKDVENLIICTGRDDRFEKETKQWLKKYNINYKEFHMRKYPNMSADWKVKQEMWEDITKRYNIDILYDDRTQVVMRARALGLKVAQVEWGNF